MGMLTSSLLLLALSLGWGWPALLIWLFGLLSHWWIFQTLLGAGDSVFSCQHREPASWIVFCSGLNAYPSSPDALQSRASETQLKPGGNHCLPPPPPTEDGMDPNLLSNGFDEDLVVLSLYDAGLLNRNKEEFWPNDEKPWWLSVTAVWWRAHRSGGRNNCQTECSPLVEKREKMKDERAQKVTHLMEPHTSRRWIPQPSLLFFPSLEKHENYLMRKGTALNSREIIMFQFWGPCAKSGAGARVWWIKTSFEKTQIAKLLHLLGR